MPLAAGARLGSYGIVGFIGAGGIGEFYKGHNTRLKCAGDGPLRREVESLLAYEKVPAEFLEMPAGQPALTAGGQPRPPNW